MKLFIAFLLIPFTVLVADEHFGCIDGKIKYLDRNKEVVLNERYCYNSTLKSISSLRKCTDNNQECLIDKPGPYKLKTSAVQTEKGSLGFNICNQLDGTPQFIEFWDGHFWIKTSRCIFNDGHYMDIPTLSLKVVYVD